MPIELDTAQPPRRGAGRYRNDDGRYFDPLPTCEIAEATTDTWDRVSNFKPFTDWTNATIKRIAEYLCETSGTWTMRDPKEVARELRQVNSDGMNAAMARGTAIHSIIEGELGGDRPMFVPPQAEPYRAPAMAFLEKYQPKAWGLEFVCINRTMGGVGYGGTCDAILEIDRELWMVDYKTRTGGHVCRAEEAAQLGAYAAADYIIRPNGDDDHRELLPDLAGGLIVSITADSARAYPVEL